MSTARRRSTVHDFSTLRLHPDGTRVPINSPPRARLHDPRTPNTGRDSRSNRVARDAAGLGVVPKRAVMCEDDGGQEISIGPDVSDDEVQTIKPRVPRRRKWRRRIDDNVEFLGNAGNDDARRAGDSTTSKVNGEVVMSWPAPSSVRTARSFFHITRIPLIILFVRRYYAAQGLLSDRSRVYRREQRQRKARVVQAAPLGAEAEADDLFVEDEEDSENGSGRDDQYEEGVVKGREKGEEESTSPKSLPDMYKAFDGSALMAIGMLLQEHVSMLLKPNIPPRWEEEIEAAGIVPENKRTVLASQTAEDDAEGDESLWTNLI
ncbi:hypothetical protein BJV74DRAFT_881612 [Russula compacta]|nr:hypothetical protein BJV74DRAFT_881612 [Russula compacta]